MADIEITYDMLEAVALSLLYREDTMLALRKVVGKKLTNNEMTQLIKDIKSDPRFSTVKEDMVKLESSNLIDESLDTIMLQYNRMLQKAQSEGKYEVVVRILKEIKELKAIENEQMKFEIIIKVEKPKEDM